MIMLLILTTSAVLPSVIRFESLRLDLIFGLCFERRNFFGLMSVKPLSLPSDFSNSWSSRRMWPRLLSD